MEDAKAHSVLFHVATGIAIFLATVLYVKYHRGTASAAALEYAAKIQQQQQEEERKANASAAKEAAEDEKKEDVDPPKAAASPPRNAIKAFQFEDYTTMMCLPCDTPLTAKKEEEAEGKEEEEQENTLGTNNDTFQCACGQGWIPPGLVKTLGGAEAIFRMGSGQCYHKQM